MVLVEPFRRRFLVQIASQVWPIHQVSGAGVIYGLIDPRDGYIAYVGQTVHILQRFLGHASSGDGPCRWSNSVVPSWVRDLNAEGLTPGVAILEPVELPALLTPREDFWIETCRSFGLAWLNRSRVQRRWEAA